MRAPLLRFIAITAAVAAVRCNINERHLQPHVWVESAQDCASNECKPVPKPREIHLHVGHAHELKIVRGEPAEVETKFTVENIVQYARSLTGPNEVELQIKAAEVGATTLNVDLGNIPPHPNDHASLRIRTFSPRVTVVGWVDGSAIDPDAIAPHASDMVKEHFRTDALCGRSVTEIALRGLVSKDLSFINSESAEQDRLYAQAFLVKSSKNHPPPETLHELIRRQDFRLLNDYQAVGEEGRRFASKLLHQGADVGETPLPCGGDILRKEPLMRRLIDSHRPDPSDGHKRNGERLETDRPERIAQLNQGRLGWLGRQIQYVLTDTDRSPDEITPWVWSLVAFDEKGQFVQKNAGFPSYSVYIDGKLKQDCGTKQVKFEDFLKRDASWQYDSAGLDVATLDFEKEGGCP